MENTTRTSGRTRLWAWLCRLFARLRPAPRKPLPPPSESQRRRIRRVQWGAGVVMVALAAGAAVVSYNDGLFLVRLAGVVGNVAYLYPLLPDGLIFISWAAVYAAGLSGVRRPGWATAGIFLGACLTLAMNVGAGVLHNDLQALVDGVVPVVLFVALENIMGLVRRASGIQPEPRVRHDSPCAHGVAGSVDEAVRQAFEHERDCLGVQPTYVDLGGRFSQDRKRVAELVRPSMNGASHDA